MLMKGIFLRLRMQSERCCGINTTLVCVLQKSTALIHVKLLFMPEKVNEQLKTEKILFSIINISSFRVKIIYTFC